MDYWQNVGIDIRTALEDDEISRFYVPLWMEVDQISEEWSHFTKYYCLFKALAN